MNHYFELWYKKVICNYFFKMFINIKWEWNYFVIFYCISFTEFWWLIILLCFSSVVHKLLIHDFYIFLMKIAFQILINIYLKNNILLKKHVFWKPRRNTWIIKAIFNWKRYISFSFLIQIINIFMNIYFNYF